MSNGIIGKILFFWVFILGGLFVAKIFGFTEDKKTLILFCVALAVVYIVWQVARAAGQRRRQYTDGNDVKKSPVHKGNPKKKKKSR